MLVQLSGVWCGWQGAIAGWLQGGTVLEIGKVGSECQERVVSLHEAGGLYWNKHRLKEQETWSVRHITHPAIGSGNLLETAWFLSLVFCLQPEHTSAVASLSPSLPPFLCQKLLCKNVLKFPLHLV